MTDESKLDLYTVLERGDRKIDVIHDQVIMMAGLTRAGKSCTFNWILDRDMVGEGDQLQATYVNITKDAASAAQGNEFVSVTLIPNSAQLDHKTTLIDMAGFGDTRNYVGVMGVSYFLKSVFEKAKEVKFLLVFSEYVFFDVNGVGIIKTFEGFLNLFKKELLDEQIKKKLFSAVSLVVTRSKGAQNHPAYLKRVLTKINHPQFNLPIKELMTEFINSMLQQNRIEAFQAAKVSENPEKCTMLERFQKLKWQFFPINEIEKQMKKSIINIPFEADFKELKGDEPKKLLDAIEDRIETYTGFNSILKELMNSLKFNWRDTVEDKPVSELPENFMDQVLDFTRVFEEIEKFLKESDKYNSEELIQQTIRAEYIRPNLVQAINSILDIYVIAGEIGDTFGSFQQNMKSYGVLFSKLANCIRPFCTNALQQRMILRLQFILKRGFREFSKFYEINPEKIQQVNQNMKDKCNSQIFDESSDKYISHFIKPMSDELLCRIFTTISALEEYEKLFNDYKASSEFISVSSDAQNERDFEFNEKSYSINFTKAVIYMKQGDKVNAGKSFIAVLKLVCSLSELKGRIDPHDEDGLNDLYMKKLKIVQKIVSILSTLDVKRSQNAKDLAISLCKHVDEIDAACEVYEKMLLDFPNNNFKLCQIYQDYSDYCKQWGRYNDAKVLLQKKLRLQNNDFNRRIATTKKISLLVDNREALQTEEKKLISRLQSRLPDYDDVLGELLTTIEELFNTLKQSSPNTTIQSMNKLG